MIHHQTQSRDFLVLLKLLFDTDTHGSVGFCVT